MSPRRSHAIAEATLISRAEAARRVHTAADLGPRVGLTGEPLPRGGGRQQRRQRFPGQPDAGAQVGGGVYPPPTWAPASG
ncbi:hypothetical protein MAHJHV28_47020 [Mycobacterium avium subsp. hominissuis]